MNKYQLEVTKEDKITLNKVCELLKINEIKVLSGFNGKVLARRFKPNKHKELGERFVLHIWSEIETSKFYKNTAHSILVCYVEGKIEHDRFFRKQVQEDVD